MPTKHKKAGPQDRGTGSATRGGQKAVTGSGRSPEVADEAADARRQDVEQGTDQAGDEDVTGDEQQREAS